MSKILSTLAESFKAAFTAGKTAVAQLRGAEATLRDRIATSQAKRRTLLAAPLRADLLMHTVGVHISQRAEAWRAAHAAELAAAYSGRISLEYGPGGKPVYQLVPPQDPECLGGISDRDCFLFRDALIAALRAAASDAGTDGGDALIERVPQLQALDAEIAAAEGELTALADEATAAGLGGVELPQAERYRRIDAQRRLEDWQADQAVNAEIYARHPGQSPPRPA
jgi:hypothetical protein